MYQPAAFVETRPAVLQALLRAQPLATVVTAGAAPDANHLPLLLDTEPAPWGTLRGHVARANPLAQAAGQAVLAVFHGPQHYVSPGWYPTKAEHGRAVPTWNYVVAHARGTLRVVDDRSWLRAHLQALTAAHEAGRPDPWRLDDAPPDYLDKMLDAIVGIELVVTTLVGKVKASQNQPPANRAGVLQALRALPPAPDAARQMAAWVEAAAAG